MQHESPPSYPSNRHDIWVLEEPSLSHESLDVDAVVVLSDPEEAVSESLAAQIRDGDSAS